jgi:hypothetical protein
MTKLLSKFTVGDTIVRRTLHRGNAASHAHKKKFVIWNDV